MEAELRTFLDGHRIKKGEPFTHTTKVPSGSYYIGEDAYESFITCYCNAIRKGARPTVTERPGAYGPLRVDFDLKATLDQGLKRQYTVDMLKKIVGFYQHEIKESIAESEFEEKMLWCVVLEKKAPRVEEGKVKDGFHLHFPYFSCEAWFQDEFLRSRITDKMIEEKIWSNGVFMEKADKFIDTHMGKKPWLMYGSAKSQGGEPFLATKFFDSNLKLMNIKDVFGEKMEGRKCAAEYYMPRFMSIRGYVSQTTLKSEVDARRGAYKSKKVRRGPILKKRSIEHVLEDIKMIKDGEIMEMLSDERAENFDTWMDVGWTLFNIGQGCDEALDLWIEFSRRWHKFVDGECEERWGKMEMRDKTIASLLSMAKSDSPDKFKEWKDANVQTFLYKSLAESKPNEWDVAQVLYKLYRDRFLCVESKKDMWYEFVNHRWQYMDDGITIKRLLATELVDIYYSFKAKLGAEQTTIGAGEEKDKIRDKLESQQEKCKKIITGLKTCDFQGKVIKMAKVVFHDINFMKKVDENKLLWVCENGVLDLELGIFRDGRPDDYMSLSCNIPFHKYNKDDDEMIELKTYFRKVFPNKNIRRYFKDSACAAMEGGNINKTFIVGSGIGDNAKTITYNMLELAFGDYLIKFPREMLIKGKSNTSAGARPELARVRGRRLIIVQEISKDETLNIGVLKELTGNDSFFARGLYEKGTEIKPMFTLFMACNEPPSVPGHDDATWNRIRIVDFESKFVKPQDLHKFPVPVSEEEQFKMKRFKADPNFGNRLPEFAPVLLSMLFARYKKYKTRGLREPEEVQMATSVYRGRNDVFLQFIQEQIDMPVYAKDTPDKDKPFLKLADLHSEFTSWYHENHSSYAKEKFNKPTLRHEFNKRFSGFGKQGRYEGWYGYRIAMDEPVDEKQKILQTKLASKTVVKKTPEPETKPVMKVDESMIESKIITKLAPGIVKATASPRRSPRISKVDQDTKIVTKISPKAAKAAKVVVPKLKAVVTKQITPRVVEDAIKSVAKAKSKTVTKIVAKSIKVK